ncbi:MAG: hypothetical protein H0Z31_05320 [Bacillus sp. (in: Bacteria)]|jgi:hypothetical protein|nr:hypothetical protein [Bacillus sp. (in: firmicutes)]
MDSVSNQIELKFIFDIDSNKKIEKELIASCDYKLIVDIEGRLDIYVNDKLFFSDQYILLLELGISLTKWIQKIKLDKTEDFKYVTMDYNDGPILEFIKCSNNRWRIYSQWQEFECHMEIPEYTLVQVVEHFLIDLQERLLNTYQINLKDYVNN